METFQVERGNKFSDAIHEFVSKSFCNKFGHNIIKDFFDDPDDVGCHCAFCGESWKTRVA